MCTHARAHTPTCQVFQRKVRTYQSDVWFCVTQLHPVTVAIEVLSQHGKFLIHLKCSITLSLFSTFVKHSKMFTPRAYETAFCTPPTCSVWRTLPIVSLAALKFSVRILALMEAIPLVMRLRPSKKASELKWCGALKARGLHVNQFQSRRVFIVDTDHEWQLFLSTQTHLLAKFRSTSPFWV